MTSWAILLKPPRQIKRRRKHLKEIFRLRDMILTSLEILFLIKPPVLALNISKASLRTRESFAGLFTLGATRQAVILSGGKGAQKRP